MDQELEPPAWAADAGPEEEWTVEMVKEMDEFRAAKKALDDEREKQRKALELELKKLRTEVSDICKGFDEKVKDLADIRVQVQVVVTTQELYSLRLAMGIMETEDDLVATARLDKDTLATIVAKGFSRIPVYDGLAVFVLSVPGPARPSIGHPSPCGNRETRARTHEGGTPTAQHGHGQSESRWAVPPVLLCRPPSQCLWHSAGQTTHCAEP